MGENITTSGIDLLSLPADTRLHIGGSAIIRLIGLRNPCSQLDHFMPGLMAAVIEKGADGELIRKAGVMGVVEKSGRIFLGDIIEAKLPPPPFQKLECV